MSEETQPDPSNHRQDPGQSSRPAQISTIPPVKFEENDQQRKNIGDRLFKASMICDWEEAEKTISAWENAENASDANRGEPKKRLLRYGLTKNGETALHIAASAKGDPKKVEDFVAKLVERMTKEELTIINNNGSTALYLAAVAGNLRSIKVMMKDEKGDHLVSSIPGGRGYMPLTAAVVFGNKDVVRYLYDRSRPINARNVSQKRLAADRGWNDDGKRVDLLEKCVESDMFDIAIEILEEYPELGRSSNVLGLLARKPEAFHEKKSSNTESNIIRRTIKSNLALDVCKKANSSDERTSPAMFMAAEVGNTNFLLELIRRKPDLIWEVNDKNQTIFHVAVKNRHEGIYNLVYEIGAFKDMVTPLEDLDGNNMLHLAAMRTTKKNLEDVPGAAHQMQQELLWFKEVESMVPPSFSKRKNKDGFTPRELFTKEHQDLIAQGEKWMKSTASQCMVVATLIATIVFAAAFTIPGEYNEDSGIPMFKQNPVFVAFVVADAISL